MLNLDRATIRKVKLSALPKQKVETEVIDVNKISEEAKQEETEVDKFAEVKKHYVEHSSKPTYTETARRFNIDIRVLAETAKEEAWFEQRIVFWNQHAADQQQSIYSANENIFKSLSVIAQLSIKEHAQIMLDVEKAKKGGGPRITVKEYDPAYNIKDAMALVKLLLANMETLKEQLNDSKKFLSEMDDSELTDLLSEDEQYELNEFYGFKKDEDEQEKELEKLNES